MLTLPSTVRVFLAVEPVDMRKSFDALALLVKSVLTEDPLSGHLFVFIGRRRHIARILFWDRSGFTLISKRLEAGVFRLPTGITPGTARVEVESADLVMLLEGIDLTGARRRRRWIPS
jgi:transposase